MIDRTHIYQFIPGRMGYKFLGTAKNRVKYMQTRTGFTKPCFGPIESGVVPYITSQGDKWAVGRMSETGDVYNLYLADSDHIEVSWHAGKVSLLWKGDKPW